MAFLESQLLIKRSKLPDSGKGLFTRKFIPKGTRICEYKGTLTTWADVRHDDGRNGYIFYITRKHVLNAENWFSSFGRYANDARGIGRVLGLTNNAEYVPEGRRVYIDATKDIPAGSEVLVAYGPEYWAVIRHNLRTAAREKKKK